MATLAAIVFVGVAAPLLAPYDPVASGDLVADRLQPPSARHPLGTDLSARDVASRLAYGTRVSIATAALAGSSSWWSASRGAAPPGSPRRSWTP
jgi:peptide/nickel transport system permease protein